MEAYNSGQRIFGENKVQELVSKYETLPNDIQWHMIGHLQTNKVKYIAPFVNLIHAVDSYKLLETINKEALKNNRVIDCLLQIHIAKEESKFGFDETELFAMFTKSDYSNLNNVRICGLMGMATFSDDTNLVRSEFKYLSKLLNKLKSSTFYNSSYFKELSMGMSDDYTIAIEEGSTMVRIGSDIFGNR
jgi:pyridoxal phosphate enzyme (YggS family)